MDSKISELNKKVYDQLANEYEKNVPNYYQPTKEAVEILSNYLAPNNSVLDVGCGVGLATELLINKKYLVTSIDISPNMMDLTKKRCPKASTIVGDFLKQHFNKKFDSIIALAFIHLFPKNVAEEVVDKMFKMIKPGGYLYIGTTKSTVSKEGWELKQDSFFPNCQEKRFRKHWTQNELKETLCKSGFIFKNIYLIDDPRHKVWMDFLVKKSN